MGHVNPLLRLFTLHAPCFRVQHLCTVLLGAVLMHVAFGCSTYACCFWVQYLCTVLLGAVLVHGAVGCSIHARCCWVQYLCTLLLGAVPVHVAFLCSTYACCFWVQYDLMEATALLLRQMPRLTADTAGLGGQPVADRIAFAEQR